MARIKLKITFHPLFWVFLIILILSNNFFNIFNYLLVVFLHELGHSVMASFLGYKLNKITILPFGASLSGKENVFYSTSHEILVAISGPLVNLILLILSLAIFWLFPVSYSFLDNFYFANLITFMFNFLPVYPLDGGRVLYAILKNKMEINKAYKVIKIVGILISSLLFLVFILSAFYKINFTIGLTSVFLLTGVFFEDKSAYYVSNFNFINKQKKLYNAIEANVICVNENTILYKVLKKLSKFKYNIIHVVNSKGKVIKILSEEEINEKLIHETLDSKII